MRLNSRCALVSIPTLSRRSCLCLAERPRKAPRFGPNVSPNANDPMLPSRSSASRSIDRRPLTTSGNANSLEHQSSPFLWIQTCEPSKGRVRDQVPLGNLRPGSGLVRWLHLCDPRTGSLKEMRTTNPSVPSYLHCEPIDMRICFDGLFGIINSDLNRDWDALAHSFDDPKLCSIGPHDFLAMGYPSALTRCNPDFS